MKKLFAISLNEQGSILMTTIVLIVSLTAVGITFLNVSDFELRMTNNDKCAKVAFFNGESGLHAMAKVVRKSTELATMVPVGASDYPALLRADGSTASDDLLYYIMAGFQGYSLPAGQKDFRVYDASDIAYTLDADLSVQFSALMYLRGSSLEFASGYEGLGGGAKGSTAVFYHITSEGQGCMNAKHTVNGQYRWVDVPGGE